MTIRIGVTPGEPAGIGPDICIASAEAASKLAEVVYYTDPKLIQSRARLLGASIRINRLDDAEFQPGAMNIQPTPTRVTAVPGICDTANADFVIQTLSQAVKDCRRGNIAAMVTGPVNKAIMLEAGLPFSGHTEWLAEQTKTKRVVMMLAAENIRVALATTHLPLAEVSGAITQEMLQEIILIIYDDLNNRFGIKRPKIAVCGLNPHAGESGHLGREEVETIGPAIKKLRSNGLSLIGPVPADTAFTPAMLKQSDAVLAMYHDQGLPVIKHAAFDSAVNVTLGLPIVRTSVDHGTALDLAGSGKANHQNIIAAIRMAARLAET